MCVHVCVHVCVCVSASFRGIAASRRRPQSILAETGDIARRRRGPDSKVAKPRPSLDYGLNPSSMPNLYLKRHPQPYFVGIVASVYLSIGVARRSTLTIASSGATRPAPWDLLKYNQDPGDLRRPSFLE